MVCAWDFSAGPCVGSAERRQLWCGVSRIYRLTSQGDSMPRMQGTNHPSAVVVVDVAAGRPSSRLPFRGLRLALASAGNLLVSAKLEPVIVLYHLAADSVRDAVVVPGNAVSIAKSPHTNRIYAVYWSGTNSFGSLPGLAMIDADSARVEGTGELPRGRRA